VKNHNKALQSLAAAVIVTATSFGLRVASAHTEGSGYYVAYRTPSGYLTRTETNTSRKAVLREFQRALFISTLSRN
jgi:hypothetical protein